MTTARDRAIAARDATDRAIVHLNGQIDYWQRRVFAGVEDGATLRAYTIARDAVAAELHRLNCAVAAGEKEPWRPQAGRRLGRERVMR